MMLKKIPMRRCLGCYESKPKKELIRVVKTSEGEICIDKTGKKNGRGEYICYNKEFLKKTIKAKRLEKEFEETISEDIYDSLRSDINSDK